MSILNRRIFVLVSILILLSLVCTLVGCKETPVKYTDFSIDNVRLCSDVREAGDYDLNRESLYYRGQPVYVYFDVYGATFRKVDEGYDVRIALSLLELVDPAGDKVAERADIFDIKENVPEIISPCQLWIFAEAPLFGPPGDYSMIITVSDVETGNTADTTVAFTVEDRPLAIENVQLCSQIRSARDYDIQPNSTYQPGDRIWIYLEIPGISVGGLNGQTNINVKVPDVKLYNPEGKCVMHITDVISENMPYQPLTGVPFLYLFLDTKSTWEQGEYYIKFTVEDNWTGDEATGECNFFLK